MVPPEADDRGSEEAEPSTAAPLLAATSSAPLAPVGEQGGAPEPGEARGTSGLGTQVNKSTSPEAETNYRASSSASWSSLAIASPCGSLSSLSSGALSSASALTSSSSSSCASSSSSFSANSSSCSSAASAAPAPCVSSSAPARRDAADDDDVQCRENLFRQLLGRRCRLRRNPIFRFLEGLPSAQVDGHFHAAPSFYVANSIAAASAAAVVSSTAGLLMGRLSRAVHMDHGTSVRSVGEGGGLTPCDALQWCHIEICRAIKEQRERLSKQTGAQPLHANQPTEQNRKRPKTEHVPHAPADESRDTQSKTATGNAQTDANTQAQTAPSEHSEQGLPATLVDAPGAASSSSQASTSAASSFASPAGATPATTASASAHPPTHGAQFLSSDRLSEYYQAVIATTSILPPTVAPSREEINTHGRSRLSNGVPAPLDAALLKNLARYRDVDRVTPPPPLDELLTVVAAASKLFIAELVSRATAVERAEHLASATPTPAKAGEKQRGEGSGGQRALRPEHIALAASQMAPISLPALYRPEHANS
eukprot:GHVT01100639.1.p1 GENE.GHVT01100639.1~~GHVT01100639.1.p1  ORF type:complete len:539 (+),score=157.03 GHVT01100639.1:3195-4811(+)